MPYIDRIVDLINDTLKAGALSRKAFQGGMFYGVAKLVQVKDTENKNTLRPHIYEISSKKETSPFINDTYSFQIYHRVISSSYEYGKDQQFGDGGTLITETTTMQAIVYGDPVRLSVNQENLAFIIITGLPTDLTPTQIGNTDIGRVSIEPLSVNHNSISVYSQEYNQSDYPLDPRAILFALSYKIETISDKACMACTDC